MNIDDDCYWIIDEEKLCDYERMDYTLPSDSQFREDIILYKMGLNDKAQEAKAYLEELQRKDKHLREQHKK